MDDSMTLETTPVGKYPEGFEATLVRTESVGRVR